MSNRFIDNLKLQAEENPIVAVSIGAVAIKALSGLLNANTQRTNAKTWEREVDRRNRKSR